MSGAEQEGKKGTKMRMSDLEAELKLMTTAPGARLCAKRLQLWRLCSHAACRRGRACKDASGCGQRLAAWVGGIKAARLGAGPSDPEADAIRLELTERLERLAQTMREEK
jgi:hypothetical protein